MAEDLSELQREYQTFIQERDWEKYHTPKSTAMSIAIEAGELMEVFQWHDNLDSESYDEETQEAVEEELADILIYSMSLAEQFDMDLNQAVTKKLEENRERFDLDSVEEINENLDRWIEE